MMLNFCVCTISIFYNAYKLHHCAWGPLSGQAPTGAGSRPSRWFGWTRSDWAAAGRLGGIFFDRMGTRKASQKIPKKHRPVTSHFGRQLCFYDWSRWWKKIHWKNLGQLAVTPKLPFPAGFIFRFHLLRVSAPTPHIFWAPRSFIFPAPGLECDEWIHLEDLWRITIRWLNAYTSCFG